MRIVLDAMGSDDHPQPEIYAAVEAANALNIEVVLVGDEEIIKPLLATANTQNANVTIVHASEVFNMDEKISGPRALRDAPTSIGIGMDLIKEGNADAFVSAGNTGGSLGIGLARLGRLKGIKRPALTSLFPVKGGYAVLADIGANAECKPEYLVQFAQMGSIYAEKVLGRTNPKVGMISNGEEDNKGNDLVKAAFPLLKESGVNFVGNIEGKEFFGGEVDVAVTDGFTGNVMLKSSEAVAKLLIDELKGAIKKSPVSMLGALLAKPAFDHLKEVLDPGAIGAIPLLGLNGLVFVAHGRSNQRDLVSAIKTAHSAVSSNLLEEVQSEFN